MKKGKKSPAPSIAAKKKSTSSDPHSSGKIPGAKLAGLLGMMGQGGGPGGPPGPMQSPGAGPNPMGSEGGFGGPPPSDGGMTSGLGSSMPPPMAKRRGKAP